MFTLTVKSASPTQKPALLARGRPVVHYKFNSYLRPWTLRQSHFQFILIRPDSADKAHALPLNSDDMRLNFSVHSARSEPAFDGCGSDIGGFAQAGSAARFNFTAKRRSLAVRQSGNAR